ncbi:hypothetical protein HanRHA438_Chr15g0733761 [Helianthus annuus]|nr:hypothetical protein HanRHA438_Chr15g0733761 [Helianthus annuus]
MRRYLHTNLINMYNRNRVWLTNLTQVNCLPSKPRRVHTLKACVPGTDTDKLPYLENLLSNYYFRGKNKWALFKLLSPGEIRLDIIYPDKLPTLGKTLSNCYFRGKYEWVLLNYYLRGRYFWILFINHN